MGKHSRNETEVQTNTNSEAHQRDDKGILNYICTNIAQTFMCDHAGPIPSLNIKALEVIEGRGGKKIKIIDSVGSQWEELAKVLDMGQEDIDMIKTTHGDDDQEACHAMLATWLEGNNGEVSWTVLSQALIDAGLPDLADNLKDVLQL